MNYKPEDMLAVIHDIRPHLKKLLGTEAQVVDTKLVQLLEQVQNLTEQMADLLQKYPQIRDFLQQFMEEKSASTKKQAVSRGEGIPDILGKVSQISPGIKVYICPIDNCDYRWFQQRIGETPPLCFDHNIPLQEEKT